MYLEIMYIQHWMVSWMIRKSIGEEIVMSTGYYFSDNYAGGIGFNFSESQFNGDVQGTTILSRSDTINKNSISNQYSILPHLQVPESVNTELRKWLEDR